MAEEEHSEEVSGRYQLGRFLSKCSNGIFYEAKDSTTGEEVMVKKITEETFRWSTPEIEILNSLKHPNVIELKDSYSYDGSLHLVFERMNYSLKQIARDPNITVSLSNIKSYLEMILQGLSYCHGKWISHRNLRLKNLFIAHDGTLKLADFGYARKLDTRSGPEIDITAVGNVFAKLVLSREDCMVNQGFTTGKKFIHRLSFMFRQLEREAIELLRKICQTRYVFSAKQALEHPYFTSYPPPTNPAFLSKPVLDLKKDIDALSALGPHIYKVDAKFEKVSIGETSGTSGEKSEEPEKDQPAAGSWIRMGKLIGKGSFGSVYEGEDTTTGEKFAVKTGLPGSHALISLRTSVTEMKMYQILQENNFQHKNIIKCLGGWENHEYNLFLTFELMETELLTVIRKEVYLSRGQVKAYLLMMLQGLEYCHSKQIIHRDIKPNNLLQSHDGHLKLADFGRACRFMQYDAFDPCDICNYMFRAPELFLSREGYGPAIDIWSAGCVFAEMIQKKRIFQGESDTDVLDKIFQLLGSNRIPNWNDWLSKYPNFRGTWYDEIPIIEFVTKGTEDALDLLSRMLVYDPSQRISAKDALAHRYFQTEPEPADPSELPGSTMSKALQKALRELAALPDSDSEGGS